MRQSAPMNSTFRRALGVVAVPAVLVLTLTACGEDTPSRADLVNDFTEEADLTKSEAKCAADAILDSDLTKDTLEKINDGDFDSLKEMAEEIAKGDQKKFDEAIGEAKACEESK